MPKSSSSERRRPARAGSVGQAPPAAAGRVDALVEELFRERARSPLGREIGGWLAASPRFRAWVERNRDKIRRKLRSAADADTLRDVRSELVVTERLLRDRRIEVAYEPYGSGRRGPDFAVTFRAGAPLNLEVTRPRPRAGGVDVRRAVVAKLAQLPPSVANIVLVDAGAVPVAAVDVGGEIRRLRQAVDTADEALIARLGVESRREFYERFLRLGGVAVRSEVPPGASFWANPSARIAIPRPAAAAVVAALGAGADADAEDP